MVVDLDPILKEIGQFGRYQIRNLLLILIAIIFSAVYFNQYIFAAGDVNYRCKVPECESSPPQFAAGDWAQFALPEGAGARCSRHAPLGGTCEEGNFLSNVTYTCDSWVYEDENTIVAAFDLACERWKRTLVGSVHSAGNVFALIITSLVSDNFGRRWALVLSGVLPGALGIVRAFSVSYYMYITFEFLEAVVGAALYTTCFVLALELVGPDYRALMGNIIISTWALGQVTTALIAWAIPYWKTYLLVIYAPAFLFVLYYWLIEESVRWLLSRGYKKEAARIIFKAAEYNKKKLSPETVKILTEDDTEKRPKETEEQVPSKATIMKQVFKSRVILSRLLICSFWWITLTFVYYGLSINSVSLAGNMYVNYILTGLVEIPAYFLSFMTLDRFGRKTCIMTAYFVCGIALVALPFVPVSLAWLRTVLNMVGKLSISMAFSSVYIYTGELFPTQVRHSMLGTCSMAGRIGSLIAPQTPLLMTYMESLPYLIFGVMAAASGALMSLTPETLRINLPDTIEQAENISKKYNV